MTLWKWFDDTILRNGASPFLFLAFWLFVGIMCSGCSTIKMPRYKGAGAFRMQDAKLDHAYRHLIQKLETDKDTVDHLCTEWIYTDEIENLDKDVQDACDHVANQFVVN